MPTLQHVLNEYLRTRSDLRPATVRQYPLFLNRCFPDWMNREVSEITKHDCLQRYAELCSLSTARATSGGKGQADNAFRVLGALLSFSQALYDAPVINPVSQFKKIAKPKVLDHREGHVPAERLQDWYQAVQKLPPTDRDINLFWLLTGLRNREAAELTWDEVDFTNRVVTVPGNRTKNGCTHRVHLCGFLILMLQQRKMHYADSKYVFPAAYRMDKPYSASARSHEQVEPLLGLDNDGIQIACNPHALRHTFATCARMSGLDEGDVSKLLNHKKGGVTGGYIHIPFEEIRPKWNSAQRFILDKLGAGTEKRKFTFVASKAS